MATTKTTASGLITRAVAEKTPARMLRAFIDGMSARKDVRVLTSKVGGPAPAALVRARRGELPDDLLDFFAEMNGATFRFTLIPDDTPMDGFEIDPMSQHTHFREREEIVEDGRGTGLYLDDFGGPGIVHLRFDNIRNERPVDYIKTRHAPPKAAKLVYSPRVDRPPRITVARSLAEYLRRGIARAFANDWPRSAAGAKIAARLDAPPRPPSALGPGARVVSKRPQACQSNGRATVVQVDTAPRLPARVPGLYTGWKWGDELVLLAFDHGPTCYVPRDSVSLIRKSDLYEEARQDPAAFLEDLRKASPYDAAMTLARIGVSGIHYTLRRDLNVPNTAPRLFALLQQAPRALVLEVLVDRLEKWIVKPDLHSYSLTLKLNGTEYEKFSYKRWDMAGIIELASSALAIWLWWLVNEQGQKSLKAALPARSLARLGALAARMGRTYSGRATAGFLAMAARGRLPPYPSPGKGWGLLFGAKAGTKFSLPAYGFVAASAFGLKSRHRVYWN